MIWGAFLSTQLDIELSFYDKCFFFTFEPAQDSMNGSIIYINFLAFVIQISKFSIHACVINSEIVSN